LFLVVKLAAVPIKFANNWRHGEKAFVQVEKIDTPLIGVGIVQPECLRFNVKVFLGIIDLKLLKVRVAIKKLLMIRDAVILDPGVGTNKTLRKPAHVSLPVADNEVEVVRSIVRGSRRFTCDCTG
jgi:hypothetical protein